MAASTAPWRDVTPFRLLGFKYAWRPLYIQVSLADTEQLRIVTI